MIPARDLLVRTLRAPDTVSRFSMGEWDMLIRQARAAGLLARLAQRMRAHGMHSDIPAPARWHLEAAEKLADAQRVAVRRELQQLGTALLQLDAPLIVLHGAAYAAAALAAAEGRLFDSIEILLPHEQLQQAEASLRQAGWQAASLSGQDGHAVAVTLHHAVLPVASRRDPDIARLGSRAVALDNLPGMYVLAAEDRILHWAIRVFHEGKLARGLRDLTDLDLLLRDAVTERDFWPRLTTRADELRLSRSLFYALRYVRHFLDTPVPDNVAASLDAAGPDRAVRALMDSIYTRTFAPAHASCADAFSPAARLAASARARWLRLPATPLVLQLPSRAAIDPDARVAEPA